MLTERIVVECYLGRKYHVIQCLNLIPHYNSVYQGLGCLGRCSTGANEKKNNYIVTRFLIVHKSINLTLAQNVSQCHMCHMCLSICEK